MEDNKEYKYDIFISYRRDTGWMLARLLYESLTAEGLSVFLDVDELRTGEFDTKIYDCIESSANFIFVLSEHSLDRCINKDDWVTKEITHAMKLNKRIIPVTGTPVEITCKLPPELERFPFLQRQEINPDHYQSTIKELIKKLYFPIKAKKVMKSDFYKTYNSQTEDARRKTQVEITKDFDGPVYDEIINKYDSLTILDVGCDKGDRIYDRFGKCPKLNKIIGFDFNDLSIKTANERYGNDKIKFYVASAEDENLPSILEKLRTENNVKFNVIHISLVLLHLQDPQKLLMTLYDFLEPGGTLFIEDVEHGLDMAYPDPQGLFTKLDNIATELHYINQCGHRQSGRRIINFLKISDYDDIKLIKCCYNSSTLNSHQRIKLFNSIYGFVHDRVHMQAEKNGVESKWGQYDRWLTDHLREAEEAFKSREFFYNVGWMLFTATKK